jgi:hypothetical protein
LDNKPNIIQKLDDLGVFLVASLVLLIEPLAKDVDLLVQFAPCARSAVRKQAPQNLPPCSPSFPKTGDEALRKDTGKL